MPDKTQPTYEDLMNGAANAYKAGDMAAAKRLVDMAKPLYASRKAPPIPEPSRATVFDPPVKPAGDATRFAMGVSDPIVGAAQMLSRTPLAPSLNLDPELIDSQIRSMNKSAEAGNTDGGFDLARMGGNVLSLAPLAMTPGGPYAGGAVAGGAGAALQPTDVDKENPDFLRSKARQTLLGTAGGVAGTALTRGAAQVVYPKVREGLNTLIKNKINVTPGQAIGGIANRFEEKLASWPVLGDAVGYGRRKAIQDMNRAVYNKALERIGDTSKAPVGRQAIDELYTKIGAVYDDAIPKAQFKADAKFNADLTHLREMGRFLPKEERSRFERIINEEILDKIRGDGFDGITFKNIQSILAKQAKELKGAGDPDKRNLGHGIDEVLNVVHDSMARNSPPQVGAKIEAANQAWALASIARKASEYAGTEEGIFNPSHLLRAVKSNDKSIWGFSRGRANLQDLADPAKTILGNSVPNSGTADRAAAMALLGGVTYVNPYAGAAAATAMTPYLPGGRNVFNYMFMRRPEFAKAPAELIRQGAAAAGPVAASVAPALKEKP